MKNESNSELLYDVTLQIRTLSESEKESAPWLILLLLLLLLFLACV